MPIKRKSERKMFSNEQKVQIKSELKPNSHTRADDAQKAENGAEDNQQYRGIKPDGGTR